MQIDGAAGGPIPGCESDPAPVKVAGSSVAGRGWNGSRCGFAHPRTCLVGQQRRRILPLAGAIRDLGAREGVAVHARFTARRAGGRSHSSSRIRRMVTATQVRAYPLAAACFRQSCRRVSDVLGVVVADNPLSVGRPIRCVRPLGSVDAALTFTRMRASGTGPKGESP